MLKRIIRKLRPALLVPRNREDLQEILAAAFSSGLIDEDIRQMMERVMKMDEKFVRDAMVPRTQMKTMQIDGSPREWVETIAKTGHSRYPVIGESLDDIRGLLLAKDLIPHLAKGALHPAPDTLWKAIIRPAYFVPESMRVDDLLSNLRKRRTHMTIVLNEYGSTAGLVTLEDVLEEIIGEIEDEHDKVPQNPFLNTGENTYKMDAATLIKDFNEHFGANLNESEVKTIGGFFVRSLGRVPHQGDILEKDGFQFNVLQAGPRKPEILEVKVPAAGKGKEEETEDKDTVDTSR